LLPVKIVDIPVFSSTWFSFHFIAGTKPSSYKIGGLRSYVSSLDSLMALSIRFETSTIPLLILGVNSLFNNDVSLMFAMESVCPILSCKYSAMAFFSFSSVRISSEFNF